MNRVAGRLLAGALPAALLALSAGASFAGEEVPISLDETVRMAIEQNLGLAVETFSPAVAETTFRRETGIYNPKLSFLADHREENFRLVPDAPDVERDRFFAANVSVEQLLSSGATAGASFENLFRTGDDDAPRFSKPTLSVSLSQPLLAGRGREVTDRGIIVAGYDREATEEGFRGRALSVAAAARDAWFDLVKAREERETRRASLAVSRQLHAENEARVRAGVLASIELLDSEFGVARREKELIEAENNVEDRADRLRVLLQHPGKGMLLPDSTFPDAPVEASEGRAMETARRLRPDLEEARIVVRREEFRARVLRNLVLPSLALVGSAGFQGFSDGYGDALDDLASGETPFWSVGLSFSYPIGNDAAEADLAGARLTAARARVSLRDLEEEAGLEVRSAIRDMETKFREIGVAKKGVDLGEARLASFLKRGRLGLATTKNILEVEADLAAARDALTAARADYQGAVTRFYRSTGELLDVYGIRVGSEQIAKRVGRELR